MGDSNMNFLKAGSFKTYLDYISNKTQCRPQPLKLWIEVTSRCNLSCRLCANRLLEPGQKGDMDISLYKKIVDQLDGPMMQLNLFHRGEPLLHPRIADMISYASQKKISTCIHTNAVLLAPETAEIIIKSGLDKIYFSLDTFDKTDYEKNRHGTDFNLVLKNIKNFIKTKNTLGSKTPSTLILLMDPGKSYPEPLQGNSGNNCKKHVIQNHRAGQKLQIGRFLKEFGDHKPDRIITRASHNWGGNIHRDFKKGKTAIKCTFPWYSATVFYDGRVCLCPQDFMGKLETGNLNSGTLREIFNGDIIKSYREKFVKKDIKNLFPCAVCDRIYRKTFAGIPLP
jgi:organic radical activating enzyme